MSVYFLVNLLNLTAPVRDAIQATANNASYVTEYMMKGNQQMQFPTIEPNFKHYTLAKGASVTVQCVSSSPISWYREENFPWIGRYFCVNDAVLRRHRKQYGWRSNAMPHQNFAELEAEFHATSMHLFVIDTKWPDLKLKENDMLQRDLESKIASCDMQVNKELIIESAKEEHSGTYQCEANWTNPDGSLHMSTRSTLQLYVLDSTEGFVFFLEDSNDTAIRIPKVHIDGAQQVVRVQPLTIAINFFSTNVSCSWYRDEKAIEAPCGNCSEQYEIRHKPTRDSLTILHPSIWDSGRYTVECSAGNGTKRNTSRNVFIEGLWEVRVFSDRQDAAVSSSPIELVCRSRGVEDPQFQLYFIKCEDQMWVECRGRNEKEKLKTTSHSKHHTAFEVYYVAVIVPEEFGIVVCEVSSKEGHQSAETILQSSSQEGIVAKRTLNRNTIIWAIVLAALLVLFFVFIVWSYRKCTEGNDKLPGITCAWDIDRLDFLPDVYRFPREKLQLYEMLGQGEYGVIWKAKVSGVVDDPSLETVVAVKETRELNDEQMMAMLLSELRAHVHVGHHLNVVNLLGAVVDNFTQGELMLITEYCQFGDLKGFFKHNVAFFENNDDDGLFGVTVPSVGAGGYPFSKTDLLFWASQVACGMNYLSTSGLIHGDLAARNVLLCDGGIVKICDFGMARVTHRDDVCRKPNREWLPNAWMALEIIREGTFTTNSDVWAYGVLLWELFTLGAEPYSEVSMDEPILDILEQGYRMQKPEYASMEVYLVMRNCWESEPTVRPTFKQLHEELHSMLPIRLCQHYARLNELYVSRNAEKETESHKTALHVYVDESTRGSMRMLEITSTDTVTASVTELQMQTPAHSEQIQM
uniref:Receptor protein-tyrosine kinase n=1 Tax=Anopheles atroparvus TaxID=41427 RepID=A0A182IMX0_ANOAO